MGVGHALSKASCWEFLLYLRVFSRAAPALGYSSLHTPSLEISTCLTFSGKDIVIICFETNHILSSLSKHNTNTSPPSAPVSRWGPGGGDVVGSGNRKGKYPPLYGWLSLGVVNASCKHSTLWLELETVVEPGSQSDGIVCRARSKGPSVVSLQRILWGELLQIWMAAIKEVFCGGDVSIYPPELPITWRH